MSKDLTIFDSKVPAHLRSAALDATTKALMGSSGYGRRISFKGGRFRMMLNGEQVAVAKTDSMEVVIIAASEHVSRTFYGGEYNPDSSEAPTCWSTNGSTPDSDVAEKQHKTCDGCPQNIKGSGKGDSKACRYSQRIAVVAADDLEGDVYQMNISALSLFGRGSPGKWPLQAYVKTIAGKGVPVTALVTEVAFDEDSSVPVVNFRPVRYLDAAEHATVLERADSEDAKAAVQQMAAVVDGLIPPVDDEDDEEEEAPKPTRTKAKAPAKTKAKQEVVEEEGDEEEEEAPKPARTKAKTKAKQEVVEEEGDEEEEEAPTKRPAKSKKVVEEDEDFASVLDAWDDED